jgi:hypothetical protein
MNKVLIVLAALVVSCSAQVWAQEERRRDIDLDRWNNQRIEWEDRSQDLWYGTPGVRVGGDLLVPLIDMIRRPSSLLDFRPRKVPSYLPDRETAEFLRERR